MDNKLDHLKKLEIGYEDTGQTEVKCSPLTAFNLQNDTVVVACTRFIISIFCVTIIFIILSVLTGIIDMMLKGHIVHATILLLMSPIPLGILFAIYYAMLSILSTPWVMSVSFLIKRNLDFEYHRDVAEAVLYNFFEGLCTSCGSD